ncbi:glucose-6-phosphate isomerase, partial [Candidatus Peregrinibacteria bacterium]|nr:glucose-6-phosphate isomerase [Candidatus Peregrinibacteria bacterium]
VITKSGGTPETLAQFLYFRNKLQLAGLDWKKQMVFITDPKKGLLRKLLLENPEMSAFDIPANVGGRFSVLTAVGLVPAALMGLDIEKLMEGARAARHEFWQTDLKNNPAFQLASVQHLLYLKGKMLTVIFPYAQKLIRLADWYRQLLAESIGKAVNLKGEQVNVGITPVFSLGATDQHSQNQLYNEGPNDKLFLFFELGKQYIDLEIPDAEDLEYLKEVTFQRLLNTEMEGTIGALTKQNRPIVRVKLDELNEWHLGYLLFFFEASTAFLGELFEINTYDQPGVELSKELTKQMLIK